MRLPIQVQAILFKKTNGGIHYLLLKRISDTGGFWQPITGGIEKGETKTQALKREIQEETGIKDPTKIIKNVHYCEFWDYHKPEARHRLVKEHVFGVEINPSEKVTLSQEHTKHKWCNFEEALKKLKEILSEHKQKRHEP